MAGCTLRYFGPVLAPNWSEWLLHVGWVFQNVLKFQWLPILCHHWQGGGSRCACGGKKRCLHVCHAWGCLSITKKFSRFHSANGTALHASQRISKAFHSLLKHVEALNGLKDDRKQVSLRSPLALSPPIEGVALWVFWCLVVLVSLPASSVCWSLATCLTQEAPPADEASDSATRSDGCKLWTWNQTELHRHICSSMINVLRMCDFSRHPDLCGGTVQFICGHAHHPFRILKRPWSDRQRKTRKASRRRLDDDNVGWREENPSLVGAGQHKFDLLY